MRFSILTAIGLAVLAVSVHSAKKEDVLKRARAKSPDMMEEHKGIAPMNTLNQILALDHKNDFHAVRSIKTIQGSTKVRANQIYSGLKVFGTSVIYGVDNNQGYTGSLGGSIVVGIDDDIEDFDACMLSKDELFTIGKKKAGFPDDCAHCSMTSDDRIIYVVDNVKAHLAYEIQLYDTSIPSRPYFIFDACDMTTYIQTEKIPKKPISSKRPRSEMFKSRSVRAASQSNCSVDASGTGGNPKTGDLYYGWDPLCLDAQKSGSTCRLESSIVKVVDLHQSTNKPGSTYRYNCRQTDDEINGAKSANLDAFYYGTVINDVYNMYYDMSPLSRQLLLYTHYGNGYENAFWDGTSMTFGDGYNYFYPLVCLDVTAHEIAHGITDANSDLIYDNQPGAINEAFSDISGEAVEHLAPGRTNDWAVGFEITKSATRALRYFEDPTRDGRSIAHVSDYNDDIDVHYTSGIYNKVFYELAVTQGVPMVDAYGCFLNANQLYWTQDTQFDDGGCGVKSAALDRGVEGAKVNAAFSVVGIDTTCCENSVDALRGGTIYNMTVAETCFSILPKKKRRYVNIKATSDSGTKIKIKISSGLCGEVVRQKKNSIIYKLTKKTEEESVVCFSAPHTVNDVTVKTRYCRKRKNCKN